MNAIEKLEAAIEKLEELKAESTPGPWSAQHWFPGVEYEYDAYWNLAGPDHVAQDGVFLDGDPDNPKQQANAALIVTTHRTIDAQLAILRDDYDLIKRNNWLPNRYVLALADAILGD